MTLPPATLAAPTLAAHSGDAPGVAAPPLAARGGDAPGVAAPALVPRRVLRVLGTSVTLIEPIKAAAERDLGLTLDFITLDGTLAQRRCALAPDSFDIYDQWFHDMDLIWPTGALQPIDIARITAWDQINALPKTGRLTPGAPLARGGDPARRLWVQLDGSLGETPSDRISLLPTVHNADGYAILGAGDSPAPASWGALLDPAWAGRVVLQSDAAIGTLDMALALQARGEIAIHDLGNLSLEEIDALVAAVRRYRAAGQFRAFWADEAAAVAAMRQGTPAIGSMWWSGITRLRAQGVPVQMVTPVEGYRGWFGGLGLSRHLGGAARDLAYAYLNWWLGGYAGAMMARAGAYIANPGAARAHLGPDEWAFWYEGAAATQPIRDPLGHTVFHPGEAREGGAYAARIARIVVWDAVMEEHNYLVRRWEHALAG